MSKLNFPIPHPNQDPSDDLATARLMLNAVAFRLETGEVMPSAEVQSFFKGLCAAAEKLDVIQLFLDDLECVDADTQYQAARRLWIMQKWGAS